MAWPKLTKNANLGPNLVVFGQKILFLLEKSKVLLPTKRKTHLGTLFALFFGRALKKRQKSQYLAYNGQKYIFWTKFGHFGAKNPNSHWRKQKFWYQRKGKTTYTPCSHRLLVSHGTKWAKNANIWPKKPVLGQNWPFWGKKSIFLGAGRKTFGTLMSGFQ